MVNAIISQGVEAAILDDLQSSSLRRSHVTKIDQYGFVLYIGIFHLPTKPLCSRLAFYLLSSSLLPLNILSVQCLCILCYFGLNTVPSNRPHAKKISSLAKDTRTARHTRLIEIISKLMMHYYHLEQVPIRRRYLLI